MEILVRLSPKYMSFLLYNVTSAVPFVFFLRKGGRTEQRVTRRSAEKLALLLIGGRSLFLEARLRESGGDVPRQAGEHAARLLEGRARAQGRTPPPAPRSATTATSGPTLW